MVISILVPAYNAVEERMVMEEKYVNRQAQQSHHAYHKVVVDNRGRIEISGVLNVDSFDDQEIVLETEQGLLAMRGEEMHIKHLNLEQGQLLIEGFLLEMAYSEKKGFLRKERGKSFIERLFK